MQTVPAGEKYPTADYNPNYDLSRYGAQVLGEEFLSQADSVPSTKYGCYIIPGTSKFSNLGRSVEGPVFSQRFGNTPADMHREYGSYEEASEFYVVMYHEQTLPIGVMRVIKNSPAGLKTLEDLEKYDLGFTKKDVLKHHNVSVDRCVDVGTLAVRPEFWGERTIHLPSLAIYRTLYLQVLNDTTPYDHVTTIIDSDAETGLENFEFPFLPMCDGDYFSYIGSERSRALIAQNDQFYPVLKQKSEKLIEAAIEVGISGKPKRAERMVWRANIMRALIDPEIMYDPANSLDAMLAFDHPYKRDKH